jgi:hypothetical protein
VHQSSNNSCEGIVRYVLSFLVILFFIVSEFRIPLDYFGLATFDDDSSRFRLTNPLTNVGVSLKPEYDFQTEEKGWIEAILSVKVNILKFFIFFFFTNKNKQTYRLSPWCLECLGSGTRNVLQRLSI